MDKPKKPKKSKVPEIVIPSELDKIKFDIKDFNFTKKQIEFYNLSKRPDVKVILIDGPAGTSKTLVSVHAALWQLKRGEIHEILYVRTPIETGDHEIGFLPGSLDEKTHPYLAPLLDKMDELLTPDATSNLTKGGYVKGIPVNYIRGQSWRNKAIIADEFQNASFKTLYTLLTRIGEGCKVFLAGDHQQSDLGRKSGFQEVYNMFNNEEAQKHGIYTFKFTEDDIVRSELCRFITKTFSNHVEKKNQAREEEKASTLLKE